MLSFISYNHTNAERFLDFNTPAINYPIHHNTEEIQIAGRKGAQMVERRNTQYTLFFTLIE